MAKCESDGNILVTGASGFVGGALVGTLLKHGCHVTAAYRRNIAHSLDADSVVVGNIDEKTDWSVALTGCKSVIHLASRVHIVQDKAANPLAEFLAVNLHGTANLAKQAAAAGVKRFVYVSSIKVNGEHTDESQSFNESSGPKPQDDYAISKWQAEQSLQLISQETGMELVILRPPLVYGPKVKANFAKLLTTVDRGIPLPLMNIQNLRSLIYVGNLVDAIITSVQHPTAMGQTYLVSDGEPISTPQLIQKVAEALNRPNRVFPMPITLMRGAARLIGKTAAIDRLTQSLVIDSSKIRNELGWQPPYTMAQGLQATAEWYRQSVKPGRA
jgi:nucleoside-diphosphate-sugar epimerase